MEEMKVNDALTVFSVWRNGELLASESLYFAKYTTSLHDWGYDSFNQFCASPEVDVSIRKANTLADLYKFFVVDCKYDFEELIGVSVARLKKVKKLHDDLDVDLDEWVSNAKTLSSSDFVTMVNELLCKKTPKDILRAKGIRGRYKLIPASSQVPLEKLTSSSFRVFLDNGAIYVES